MTEVEKEKAEEDRLYWRKVGWKAHEFGLPYTANDVDVLSHEKKQRQAAQGLPEDSNWLQIYCAELRAGLTPVPPDYCDDTCSDSEDHHEYALEYARAAAKIFMQES